MARTERFPVPWRSLFAALVAAVVGLAVGVVVARPDRAPGRRSLDVRALQDLRYLESQAVGMSLVLIAKPDTGASPALRQLARQIVEVASGDSGRMAQVLATFDAPLDGDGDAALEWMGAPVPLNEIPGLASDDDKAALDAAAGNAADRLYVRLLVAHHQGVLAAAGYVVAHARTGTVRRLARDVTGAQHDEITQLQAIAATL